VFKAQLDSNQPTNYKTHTDLNDILTLTSMNSVGTHLAKRLYTSEK